MYKKPTKEQIEFAVENGWSKEQAERGFDIFNYDGRDLFEVQRIDEEWAFDANEITDEDCAREAERTGFCKIIPVDELPENFNHRYFGWVDTPENRKAIKEYCKGCYE